MKSAAVIAGAFITGMHWQSRLGWFIVIIVAMFLITIINEQGKKERD